MASADAPVEEAVLSAYEQLAAVPSVLLSVALEDAVEERRPSRAPRSATTGASRCVPLEELLQDERAVRLAAMLQDGVSGGTVIAG